MSEKHRKCYPAHTSIHPPLLPTPSSTSNSLGHYFIPQHPRRSNHLDNRWRSEGACPVVLFLSSPVSLISAKSSIPPSFHPWASERNTRGEQDSGGIHTKCLSIGTTVIFTERNTGFCKMMQRGHSSSQLVCLLESHPIKQ